MTVMNLLRIAALLHVLQLGALATDCNFGTGCRFSCQCEEDKPCDPLTGQCEQDAPCMANLPDYPPSQPGWRDHGCQTGNVAYNKKAWQYYEYPTRVASRAVDGEVERTFRGAAQPRGLTAEDPAWWTVDLGDLHTIYSVRMMNPDLKGFRYLNHIRVYVSNSPIPDNNPTLSTEADITRYGTFVTCGEHNDIVPRRNDAEVVCEQPLVGRYVLLWKTGTSSNAEGDVRQTFIISEVTVIGHRYQNCTDCRTECNAVYGCIANCSAGKDQKTFCSADCEAGSFGVNCGEQCSGNCANGADCSRTDGTCPGGCKQWYTDTLCGTEIVLPGSDLVHTLASRDVTSGSVTLTWDPLNSVPSGLESHYGYVIDQQSSQKQRSGDTGGEWMNITLIPYSNLDKVATYTVTNLAHNSLFSFRLQVYREDRGERQTADQEGTVSVQTACISPSSPVVHVQYLSVNYGKDVFDAANVTWDLIEPTDSGCDFITSYVLASFDQGDDILGNTTSSSLVQTNVTRTYVINVTAINNKNLQRSTLKTIKLTTGQEEVHTNTSLIVGLIVTLGVIVAVILVAVFLWRRRKLRAEDKSALHPEARRTVDTVEFINGAVAGNPGGEKATPSLHVKEMAEHMEDKWEGDDDETQSEDGLYENPADTQRDIPLDMLEHIYREIKTQTKGFYNLYHSITIDLAVTTTIAEKEVNRVKNRFKNILAYDHSRVTLATSTGDGYVNASYIKGYDGDQGRCYVATQGPIPSSKTDFWEMMWQLKSRVVVMLTPLFEKSKRKCECYWPEAVDQSETCGVLTVTMRQMEIYADYVRRKFTLKTSQGAERNLEHFQYLAWPDKERPLSTFALMGFLRVVRNVHSDGVPLIVHCSAGVGRTGTFIALDYLLREAEATCVVNIVSCVRQLREQRTKMVQTQAQFEFLYEALIDYAKVGRTALPCDDFRESYSKLTMNGSAELKRQFKTVRSLIAEQPAPALTSGATEVNLHKNRFPDILPDDDQRPCLSSRSKTGNDYINAVFVKGFQKSDSFIVTQAPLQQTTADFWRLIYDFRINTIVMLNENQTEGMNAPCYWPQQGKLTLEPFGITLKETTTHAHWVQREFDVKHEARLKSDAVHVRQYQLTKWEDGRPGREALNALLELQQAAMAYGQRHPTQPVLVHCLDGATRCGLFCALDHVIGATTSQGEVDISLAARSIAASRREFLRDMDQYVTLHDLVLEYLSKFETYANYQ